MTAGSKIKVEICVGTTCFILGASELQEIEQFLPDDLRDRVEICGSPCLGFCRQRNDGQAPFVRITHDTVVSHATIESVIAKLQELTANER